jgi:ribosomal protein S18 acetylase RimI-like enzyme
MVIRLARHDDIARLRDVARAAYQIYLPRMDRPPAPMRANFAYHVRQDFVFVAEDRAVCGYAVLCQNASGWQLENIAVTPERQGAGIGRALVARCEAFMRALNIGRYRLYTNGVMTENIGWYQMLGFVEINQRRENGFNRIYFEKTLNG